MAKGSQGDGSVYQRKSDGLWIGAYIVQARDSTARRPLRYVSGKTKTEALRKLRKAQAQYLLEGKIEKDLSQNATVEQLLTKWLDMIIKPHRTFKTYESYESKVRLYLVPHLGRHRVRELEVTHVESALAAIQAEGAGSSVARKCRQVLRTAMAQAIRWGWVKYNVVSATENPRPPAPEPEREWSEDDARTILEALERHSLADLIFTQMGTGGRIGEVLGLRFQDMERDKATGKIIGVRFVYQLQTHRPLERVGNNADSLEFPRVYELVHPKTRRGRRTQEVGPLVAEVLERAIAKTRAMEAAGYKAVPRTPEGLAQKAADWGLIFRTRTGTPHTPQNVGLSIKRAMKGTEFEGLTTHDLRRLYTTMLDSSGVQLRVIQENLGHSRPDTTLRYSKATKESRRVAADAINEKLKKAMSGTFAAPVAEGATEVNPKRRGQLRKRFAFPLYGKCKRYRKGEGREI